MDEYLRIDDAEFARMLEDAGKILETMSPEAIAKLRALCTDELGGLARLLVKDNSKFKRLYGELKESPIDYDSDNPLKQAKKKFWLGQLANFIAVTVFRLPREFTPTYAFPFGSSRKFAEQAKATDEKLNRLVKSGKDISESTSNGLYEIKRKITEDDARLIVFCNSCDHIDAAFSKLNVSPHFREIASLLYQNNVSFPASIYSVKSTYSQLTDRISSIVEKVKNSYREARGNVTTPVFRGREQ